MPQYILLTAVYQSSTNTPPQTSICLQSTTGRVLQSQCLFYGYG